jgi:lycopene beta-cyclase
LWTREPNGLSSAAAARWDTIAVHASGSSTVLALHPYRYVAISGERLHDLLHTRLEESSNVEFVTRSADSAQDDGDHAVVTLNGAAVTARWAFDGRPGTPAPAGPRLDFVGWEIDTDTDAFDPTVAASMDFRGRQPSTVSFF